jgi:hypothetical protein
MYDAVGAKCWISFVQPSSSSQGCRSSTALGPNADGSCRRTWWARSASGFREPKGELLGLITADNWRSWDFAIEDSRGSEVGRITKRWAGILREGFTTADRYLLHVAAEVPADLRLLMFASAAGIDTALKQDDTGGWGFGGIDLDI